MKVGEAFIEVRPDTSKFGPELTRSTEQAGSRAASGLGAALAGGAVIAGLTRVIGSASDLNEAMNKTRATFGEASGSVEQFAATSADSFGISEAAALDLAGGLGAMLIPLGTSQEEAAGMSTTLLELAADMGSFSNQDPTEMLDRLRAGLAGEAEPLRQFGVTLNEARVQQFAWENGIAEAGVALTDQQKIMARYGIILQDTATQQGDFANTADSAANAQRRAAATAEDAAASTGSNFLPVYEAGVAVVQKFAAAFGALPGPLQTASVLLAGFAALRGPLGGAFSAIAESARAMATRFREAGGGMSALRTAITPGALGVSAAVIGIGLITQEMAENAAEAQHAESNFKALAEAFTEGGERAQAETFLSQLNEDLPDLIPKLEAAQVSTADLIEAAADPEAFNDLLLAIAEVNDLSITDLGAGREPIIRDRDLLALQGMQAGLAGTEDASANLTSQQERTAEATETASSRFDDQVSALQEVADSADAAHDALDALFGIQQGLNEANREVQQTADDLSRSIRENGHRWNESTQAGRDNRTAAEDAAKAIVDSTIAYRANGASVAEATRRHHFLVGGLRDTLLAAGLSRGEVERLIGTYGRVQRRILTDVQVTGTAEAVSQINAVYRAALDAAQAVNQISGSLAGGGSYNPPGQAMGGPYEAGQAFLVGERGPELRVENHAGHTFTAAETANILSNSGPGTAMGGGGGGDSHLHFGDVYGDPEAFARSIAPVVGRELAAIDRGV